MRKFKADPEQTYTLRRLNVVRRRGQRSFRSGVTLSKLHSIQLVVHSAVKATGGRRRKATFVPSFSDRL